MEYLWTADASIVASRLDAVFGAFKVETGMFKIPSDPKIVILWSVLLPELRTTSLLYFSSKISFQEFQFNTSAKENFKNILARLLARQLGLNDWNLLNKNKNFTRNFLNREQKKMNQTIKPTKIELRQSEKNLKEPITLNYLQNLKII